MPAASSTLPSVGLRGVVGMIGHIHDQEGRNSLIFGHVRHGREVAMLCRVIAKLFPVAEFQLRLAVNPAAGLGGLDHGRDVIRVSVHGHATLDDSQRQPLGL